MGIIRSKVLAVLVIMIALLLPACTGAGTVTVTQKNSGSSGPPSTSVTTVISTLTTTLAASQTTESSFVFIANQITPSIVRVEVTGNGFSASGTGFFVDARGYIMTNEHVIDNANQISITLADGSTSNATVVSSDTNRDIALLKVSTGRTDYPAVILGSSAGAAAGFLVIVAGFPLGMQLPGPVTFTHGIVSSKRNFQGWNYLQIDAPINPGNSGGPLVDVSTGQVLGIVTAGINPVLSDTEDIGLAIPIDEAKSMIQNGVGK